MHFEQEPKRWREPFSLLFEFCIFFPVCKWKHCKEWHWIKKNNKNHYKNANAFNFILFVLFREIDCFHFRSPSIIQFCYIKMSRHFILYIQLQLILLYVVLFSIWLADWPADKLVNSSTVYWYYTLATATPNTYIAATQNKLPIRNAAVRNSTQHQTAAYQFCLSHQWRCAALFLLLLPNNTLFTLPNHSFTCHAHSRSLLALFSLSFTRVLNSLLSFSLIYLSSESVAAQRFIRLSRAVYFPT